MSQERSDDRTFQWVARVGDIGLFQAFLKTRARLVAAALGSTTMALAASMLVSEWIRNSSGSPTLNILVIGLMLATLVIAAYLDALMIGDLFFPGRWRERVLLGKKLTPRNFAEERAFIQEYNVHFLIIVLVSILSLVWVSQQITRGFLSYYQDLGFALSLIRSDDPDDRVLGLEEIGKAYYEKSWSAPELHEALAASVNDPNKRVRLAAYYTAGRLHARSAGPTILERYRSTDDVDERAAAAQALGRMGYERALSRLSQRLRAIDTPRVERLAIIQGFAFMGHPRGGPATVRLIERCFADEFIEPCDEEDLRLAFYALRNMRFEGGRKVATQQLLDRNASEHMRCVAADALRYIATDDDIQMLRSAYYRIDPAIDCEETYWKQHNETPIPVADAGTLRSKLVRAVGNRKDFGTYEWIASVVNDTDERLATRQVAEFYATSLLQAYRETCQGREHLPRCQIY